MPPLPSSLDAHMAQRRKSQLRADRHEVHHQNRDKRPRRQNQRTSKSYRERAQKDHNSFQSCIVRSNELFHSVKNEVNPYLLSRDNYRKATVSPNLHRRRKRDVPLLNATIWQQKGIG